MMLLLFGVIVVIASIVLSVAGLFLMNMWGDEYNVSREYTVTGTITESEISYDCTGYGKTSPVEEPGPEHLYTFYIKVTYSDSKVKEITFNIFCDKDGVPLSSFYTKNIKPDGTVTWSQTDGGLTYEFTIEKYCKVTWATVSGDGLSLEATIKE